MKRWNMVVVYLFLIQCLTLQVVSVFNEVRCFIPRCSVESQERLELEFSSWAQVSSVLQQQTWHVTWEQASRLLTSTSKSSITLSHKDLTQCFFLMEKSDHLWDS